MKQKEVSPDKQGKQQITRSKLRASAQITIELRPQGKWPLNNTNQQINKSTN